jgi:hypothetical protein
VSIAALRKYEPAADGFFDLDDAPDARRAALAVARAALVNDASDQTLSNIAARLPEQLPGASTFTARDMAVLNAVDRVVVVDDIDYTGLFDYDD